MGRQLGIHLSQMITLTETPEGRACTVCGEFAPWNSFCKENPTHARSHKTECATCRRIRMRKSSARWRLVNRERLYAERRVRDAANIVHIRKYKREYAKVYNRKNPWKRRSWDYHTTIEHLANLWELQNHCCAICFRPLVEATDASRERAVHVDHDHTTGTVRGLLCYTCNAAIGMMKDSPELLENTKQYLIRWGK